MCTSHALEALAAEVGSLLRGLGNQVVTAESCTGGGIACALTSVAGSSQWFEQGFVTYSNRAKTDLLNVAIAVLEAHGAVSEAVVAAMAEGALRKSAADWAVAVSGIAGPDGGTVQKPVGMVCFAWAHRTALASTEYAVETATQIFSGNRAAVRAAAVFHALEGLKARLSSVTINV